MMKMGFKQLLDAMPLPEGEPFPGETLRADGWEYRDLPRMTREACDALINVIGNENIRWLSFADYGSSVRGQCFVSPSGMANMTASSNEMRDCALAAAPVEQGVNPNPVTPIPKPLEAESTSEVES